MTTAKTADGRRAVETKPGGTLYVLDSTATPLDPQIPGSGPRTHEMIINGVRRPFVFEYGKPLELPIAIAVKFLRHDSFRLCDEMGNMLEYRRRPKQPDELQMGETFSLSDDETIARYDELSAAALHMRVLELPGGEKFDANADRAAMIEFIIESNAARRKENTSAEEDIDADSFVPEAA